MAVISDWPNLHCCVTKQGCRHRSSARKLRPRQIYDNKNWRFTNSYTTEQQYWMHLSLHCLYLCDNRFASSICPRHSVWSKAEFLMSEDPAKLDSDDVGSSCNSALGNAFLAPNWQRDWVEFKSMSKLFNLILFCALFACNFTGFPFLANEGKNCARVVRVMSIRDVFGALFGAPWHFT